MSKYNKDGKDGDVPQEDTEKGDRPLFLGLSLLVNFSKKNWDYPPSLKKGPVPFLYKVVPWGTSPILPQRVNFNQERSGGRFAWLLRPY
jgi:hypothetical protein